MSDDTDEGEHGAAGDRDEDPLREPAGAPRVPSGGSGTGGGASSAGAGGGESGEGVGGGGGGGATFLYGDRIIPDRERVIVGKHTLPIHPGSPAFKPAHFVSAACEGERCQRCWLRAWIESKATHKLEESVMHDDPQQNRHPLTSYVCCDCFGGIFGGRCNPASSEKG